MTLMQRLSRIDELRLWVEWELTWDLYPVPLAPRVYLRAWVAPWDNPDTKLGAGWTLTYLASALVPLLLAGACLWGTARLLRGLL